MGNFFSINNPVLFTIVMFFAIVGLIYMYYRYIIQPLNLKHALEKEKLELKNVKLMALFSELDPEPVFRFNSEGNIISANTSGLKIFNDPLSEGISVASVFPSLGGLNFRKCIEEGITYRFASEIKKNFYDITVKGVTEFGFGQIYCNDITIRMNAEEELRFSKRKLQELSRHIQVAQEKEKQNLSRELHDNFGQILTTIKLNLELLKERESGYQNEISEVFTHLEKAMNEVRDLSHRLKPRILDDLGLVPSLRLLCNDVTSAAGIKNIFQVHDFNDRVRPELETCLYRIAQEALNNIVKHSRASEFSVQLFQRENIINMMIEDDGVGFDKRTHRRGEHGKGKLGLLNMEERALSYGGKCVIDSRKESGTSITVELPLEDYYE